MQLTEDATLTRKVTSNYFGDITNIQNESQSDTEITLSSQERVVIKITMIGKIVAMNQHSYWKKSYSTGHLQ